MWAKVWRSIAKTALCPWVSYSGVTLWINKVHTLTDNVYIRVSDKTAYTYSLPKSLHRPFLRILTLEVTSFQFGCMCSLSDFSSSCPWIVHKIRTTTDSLLCAAGSQMRFVEGLDWPVTDLNLPVQWSNTPNITHLFFLIFVQSPNCCKLNWFEVLRLSKSNLMRNVSALLRSDNLKNSVTIFFKQFFCKYVHKYTFPIQATMSEQHSKSD